MKIINHDDIYTEYKFTCPYCASESEAIDYEPNTTGFSQEIYCESCGEEIKVEP